MKHVIIGTAGHVDHGKTSLIQALTGIDTDRLSEEKRRGLTIDLGFAHLLLGEVQAGIVDVPGHERFAKNMLAGVGQIGLALMVVAADEGVMPQTTEHLSVLELLGVAHGVVALTKAELVDADGLALARQELSQQFRGSFLQSAPVVPVSAKTGAGLDALRAVLERAALMLPPGDEARPFRMCVDRVFTINGIGLVAAGVVAQGRVAADDLLCVYPSGQSARVRGIQVYGEDVRQAVAGQRAALNLARVKTGDVRRGDVLAAQASIVPTALLDVRLQALAGGGAINNNQRAHLYLGTDVTLCRIVLLGRDTLDGGAACYAQLRLEKTVAASGGERFVLRFYSPLSTIGGGTVLHANPPHHRRGDAKAQAALRTADSGAAREQVLLTLGSAAATMAQARALLWQLTPQQFDTALQALLADETLLPLNHYAIAAEVLRTAQIRAVRLLEDYHKANPRAQGMPRPQIKSALFSKQQQPAGDAVLSLLVARGAIVERGGLLASPSFCVTPQPESWALAESLKRFYQARGCVPSPVPKSEPPAAKFSESTARMLCGQGALVRIPPDCYLCAEHYAHALQLLRQFMAAHGSITLAQYRDLLGISRKPTQQLLEHFDAVAITRKAGDGRVLR